MTTVAAYSYTHSVTYVADNILKSLKDVVRLSGLSPEKLVGDWGNIHTAVRTWLGSGDLTEVILEVFHPSTNALVARWDIEVVYQWSGGDGSFWTDTEQLRYAIRKAGVWPSDASYELALRTKPGRPDVPGWGPGQLRSTDGFVRQSLGRTVEHSGLGAATSYWRKA